MRRALGSAVRRGLASVLLISAVLGAVWVAEFKTWYPAYWESPTGGPPPVPHSACIHTRLTCISVAPGWALPVGIVLGIVGVLLAALLYSPRPLRRRASHA